MEHLIVTAILAGAPAGCVGSDGSQPATVTEGVNVLHISDFVGGIFERDQIIGAFGAKR